MNFNIYNDAAWMHILNHEEIRVMACQYAEMRCKHVDDNIIRKHSTRAHKFARLLLHVSAFVCMGVCNPKP